MNLSPKLTMNFLITINSYLEFMQCEFRCLNNIPLVIYGNHEHPLFRLPHFSVSIHTYYKYLHGLFYLFTGNRAVQNEIWSHVLFVWIPGLPLLCSSSHAAQWWVPASQILWPWDNALFLFIVLAFLCLHISTLIIVLLSRRGTQLLKFQSSFVFISPFM